MDCCLDNRRGQPLVIGGENMKLRALVESGDKIGLLTLQFLIIGIILILYFSLFGVGGQQMF